MKDRAGGGVGVGRNKQGLWGGETTVLRGWGKWVLLVISWTGLLLGLNPQAEEVTH